jgi:tRNA 2-thiouridine synthesizing protein D
MMKSQSFTILVSGGALNSQANLSALNFAANALSQSQAIRRVFFYAEGATVASSLIVPLSDELDVTKAWQALHTQYGLDLRVCIASAERRGVIGRESAKDHRLDNHNLADGFRIVGLADYHDALLSSSHLVRFA